MALFGMENFGDDIYYCVHVLIGIHLFIHSFIQFYLINIFDIHNINMLKTWPVDKGLRETLWYWHGIRALSFAAMYRQ